MRYEPEATVEERASRRYQEVIGRGGAAEYDDVLIALRRRDRIDSGREVAPLRVADDAVVIDTTPLDIEQTLETVLTFVDGQVGDV